MLRSWNIAYTNTLPHQMSQNIQMCSTNIGFYFCTTKTTVTHSIICWFIWTFSPTKTKLFTAEIIYCTHILLIIGSRLWCQTSLFHYNVPPKMSCECPQSRPYSNHLAWTLPNSQKKYNWKCVLKYGLILTCLIQLENNVEFSLKTFAGGQINLNHG